MAEGKTIIENPAKEPHIVDVANFLNSMGANIKGAGTDAIRIRGVEALHGAEYSIIPDQIEAGTYMLAVAATGGDVMIKNVIPKHLEAITAKLVEIGAIVEMSLMTAFVSVLTIVCLMQMLRRCRIRDSRRICSHRLQRCLLCLREPVLSQRQFLRRGLSISANCAVWERIFP